MTTRKDNEKDQPPNKGTDDAQGSQLPMHRPQSRALLDAPRKGLVVIVERSADAYFSTCRRIANFLNRSRS